MDQVTIERASSAQYAQMAALLEACALPLAGLREHMETALVARVHGLPAEPAIVGSAALELYGASALLRSVAVAEDFRGTGLGGRLVDHAIALAHAHGVTDLYLLTETAADYFVARGFVPLDRQAVTGPITQSIEFVSACPASAQAMRLRIGVGDWGMERLED